MFPWESFFYLILQGMLHVYSQSMFWLVLALVALQYRRQRQAQIKMFGYCNFSLAGQVVSAALYGTAGGILGSFILTFLGVSVTQMGLLYIWPLAIALMFIDMRFMCFAYAGGIVAAANIIFGWPEVNPPQVLVLVAGLHVTESLLIYISGRYGAMPLILKQADGRLVGAFSLQNFWPLPLVLMTAELVSEAGLPAAGMIMPDWWPILPVAPTPAGQNWVYAMAPVVAALGYSDIAVTSLPSKRRRRSALHLAIYSLTLLLLAVLSTKYQQLQIIAAILSPLGHELLIQLDSRREKSGPPRFVQPPEGVMILETVGGTPARKLGLQPGDILLKLAGLPMNNGFELARAISFAPEEFELLFLREGRLLRQQGKFINGERRFGVILVPQGHESNYAEIAGPGFGLWSWLKKRQRRK